LDLFRVKNSRSADASLGGITLKDFLPIKDVLKSDIAPDDTHFTTKPFPPNLSIIVSCTQTQHGQVRDLLTKLREIQAVTIELKMQFLVVKAGNRIETTKSISEPMSAEACETLCKMLSKGSIASIEIPSKTIYNGQTFDIESDSMAKAGLTPTNITVTTSSRVSGITLACCKSPESTAKNSMTVALKESATPPIPASVLLRSVGCIAINQKGLGIMDVSGLLKNSAANRKAFLLVYPKIIDRRDEILKSGNKPIARH
jgi:hypothetical protein